MLLWGLPRKSFSLSGLCCGPERSFVFAISLYCILSRVSQKYPEVCCTFLFSYEFFKSVGVLPNFIHNICLIFIIISRFLSCFLVEVCYSSQSQNLYPLIPCWILQYYLSFQQARCHNRHEEWPYHQILFPTHSVTLFDILSFLQL